MKKLFSILLIVVLGLTILAGCSAKEEQGGQEPQEQSIVVTDMLGRDVEIPANPEKFVNVGVGSLRLYTYVAPLDKLVGVEKIEAEGRSGVPFSAIYSETFNKLPIIGQGGPAGSADPEQILAVGPDVIFNTYARDKADADDLQEKTGLPVIVLSYGESDDVFDEELYASLRLIGKITGEAEKAEEVVTSLEKYKNDLIQRTQGIAVENRPTVYVGALGNRGARGIESTRGNYTLLNVLHAQNVVDSTNHEGAVIIDKEMLLEWDPQYIFIDLDGIHLVEEDYQKNPSFYQALSAVKNENAHVQLPYILLRANLETAIADAYYMGMVLYPNEFSDIDPVAMADEIYIEFLGQPFYQQMVEDYRGFGKITFEN